MAVGLVHGQREERDEYDRCAHDATNIQPICYSSEAHEVYAKMLELDSVMRIANLLLSAYTQSVCGQDRQQLTLPWRVGTGAQNRPGMTAFRQSKTFERQRAKFRTYIHRHQEILILARMGPDTPPEEP